MHRVLHQSMDDFKQKKNIKSWLEHYPYQPVRVAHDRESPSHVSDLQNPGGPPEPAPGLPLQVFPRDDRH